MQRPRLVHTLILLLGISLSLPSCRSDSVPAPGTDAYETAVTAFYTGVSALQVGENFRAEQQGGASADRKALELMQRLQALRPDNLLALVETARLAAKAGDAQILRSVLVYKTGLSTAACNNGNKAAFH